MIRVVKFEKKISCGSSLPLIVWGEDGIRYVVKASGCGDGIISNIIEWLCARLASRLGIPILDPVLLQVPKDLLDSDQDPEIIELMNHSVGINFGTVYRSNAQAYSAEFGQELDVDLKSRIFLFDLFLMNVDRTEENPNMMLCNGVLLTLDYGSSFGMRSIVDGKNYGNHNLLKEIRRHPFHTANVQADAFISQLQEIKAEVLCGFVDEIPESWLLRLNSKASPAKTRRAISQRLMGALAGAGSLIQQLELLSSFTTETPLARRKRAAANRQAFKDKFDLLS